MGTHTLLASFKRLQLKLSSAKNRFLFLKRCVHHNIIPKFLVNRCPLHSNRANELTKKYQTNLLKDCLSSTRGHFYSLLKEIDQKRTRLKQTLSPADFENVTSIVNKAYERSFCKHKNKHKSKFECLQRNHHPSSPPSNSSTRPSTINNPVLQLQPNQLPPEIIALLEKGPKFIVTPKNDSLHRYHSQDRKNCPLPLCPRSPRKRGKTSAGRLPSSPILHCKPSSPQI